MKDNITNEDVLKIVNDFTEIKNNLKIEIQKIGNKKGKLITSPSVCALFQTLPDFVLDKVDLIPEENESIYRFGYYKNITVMRDYYARTDYIKFEENN